MFICFKSDEALAIIQAAGLKLVNRSMQITYDSEGKKGYLNHRIILTICNKHAGR